MKWQVKRKLSVLMSAALVLSSINIGPVYGAKNDNTEKTIVGFEKLEEKYALQQLETGAKEQDIRLPAGLWTDMVIEKEGDGEEIPEAFEKGEEEKEGATGSEAKRATLSQAEAGKKEDKKTEKKAVRKKIREVEWELNFLESTEPEFISGIEGTYVYEPVLPSGYELNADLSLPQIKVIVEEAKTKKAGAVLNAEELKAALLNSTDSVINVGADITLSESVTSKANHTLNIPDGIKLTVKADQSSSGQISSGSKKLTFQGGGELLIQKALKGNIDLNDITVRLEPYKDNGIRANELNVNDGAVIVADFPQGKGFISVTAGKTMNVNSGGRIEINKFSSNAINCEGTININSGGTIAMESSGTGINLTGKAGAVKSKLNIADGGSLTSQDGGGIYLIEGSKVEGMAGLLNDRGKEFTLNEETAVGAADSSADPLTEGFYVGVGGKFIKPSTETKLEEGILTISAENGKGTGWGWSVDKQTLDLNDKFKGNKQIVFAPGISAVIKLNKDVTMTPDAGNPAITAYDSLTITAPAEKHTLTAGKIETQGDLIIHGCARVAVTADPSDSALQAGGTVTVSDMGAVIGIGRVEAQGGLTVKDSASVTVTANSLKAAVCVGSGKTITISGASNIKAGNEGGPAMNMAPDTSGYEGACKITASEDASGKPETEYKAADIARYHYLEAGKESIETKLENGILTITPGPAGYETETEGWNWSTSRKTLDLNDKFKGNKQIVFAPGVSGTIKLNKDVTITPDSGKPAITAEESLIITAPDTTRTLTTSGKIVTKGDVTIHGCARVAVTADPSDSALQAGGTVTVSDMGAVIGIGRVEAQGGLTVKDSANMDLAADSPEAAVNAGSGKTITISGAARVKARNEGGPAMNMAPNTSGYGENLQITASEKSSGRPRAEYKAADIARYQYLEFETGRDISDIPTTVDEIEAVVDSIKDASDEDTIALVIDQIMKLTPRDRKDIKPETAEKLDQLLQEVTGIEPVSKMDTTSQTEGNKQIKKAQISGALLAAGITTESEDSTEVEFRVTQKQPENRAAVIVDCSLYVNGSKVDLKTPVTVLIELPPEYIPIDGYRIHHVGNGIDEWLDFIYDEDYNTAKFQTSSFSTFSIVEQWPTSHSGSGSSGGGGGGGGGRSVGPLRASAARSGKWIQDAVGWWYQNADKTYPKDGWFQLDYLSKKEWYYFDKNGYMKTGWMLWNKNWYYLNPASDGTGGKMETGWQFIDNKWYFLNEASDGTRGVKLMDAWVGEYYLNSEGIWEEGKKKQ